MKQVRRNESKAWAPQARLWLCALLIFMIGGYPHEARAQFTDVVNYIQSGINTGSLLLGAEVHAAWDGILKDNDAAHRQLVAGTDTVVRANVLPNTPVDGTDPALVGPDGQPPCPESTGYAQGIYKQKNLITMANDFAAFKAALVNMSVYVGAGRQKKGDFAKNPLYWEMCDLGILSPARMAQGGCTTTATAGQIIQTYQGPWPDTIDAVLHPASDACPWPKQLKVKNGVAVIDTTMGAASADDACALTGIMYCFLQHIDPGAPDSSPPPAGQTARPELTSDIVSSMQRSGQSVSTVDNLCYHIVAQHIAIPQNLPGANGVSCPPVGSASGGDASGGNVSASCGVPALWQDNADACDAMPSQLYKDAARDDYADCKNTQKGTSYARLWRALACPFANESHTRCTIIKYADKNETLRQIDGTGNGSCPAYDQRVAADERALGDGVQKQQIARLLEQLLRVEQQRALAGDGGGHFAGDLLQQMGH